MLQKRLLSILEAAGVDHMGYTNDGSLGKVRATTAYVHPGSIIISNIFD